MPNEKTNLLVHYTTVNRVALLFIFVASILLGTALITVGGVSIARFREHGAQLKFAKENAARITELTSVRTNETANPGPVLFYFDTTIAGVLAEDGTYQAAPKPDNNGVLFVVFAKPQPPVPGQVRFPAQTLTLQTPQGELVVCTPSMNSGRGVWADQKGNTYLDKTLSIRARSCT